MRRITGPRTAAAVVVALAVVLTTGLPANAAPRPDFPTWDEVERARASEAATQRTIDRIEGILLDLEAEAAELGRTALIRAEEAQLAEQELAAAEARASSLAASVERAQERADASARRAGQILAHLARTGGGDVTLELLLASEAESDDLLTALGTMARLGDASAALLERAVYDRNTARALADQARIAEERRADLAVEAELAAGEAQRAVEAAEDRAAAQRAAAGEMYAQLASLRDTTTELEREYQEGLAWEEEQAADPTPPQPPPSDPDPPAPDPPAPSPNKVAGAIAFAKAQLGEPYGWGAAGPNSWDCSGLTLKSWASVGVAIGPHGSTSQYNTLKSSGRLVSINDLAPGDLLFYSNGGSTGGVKYHVTMYIGGGSMIEAPYPGQVVRIVPIRYGDLVPYVGRPTA